MFSDAHVAELKVHKVLAKHEVDTQPYVRMCFRFISFERLPAHVKVPKVSIWIATESRRLEFGLQPTSDGLQPNALILNLQSNPIVFKLVPKLDLELDTFFVAS